MGVGTHKHDCLVSLNDFAFTNALVKRGGRRRRQIRKRSSKGNEEKEEEENDDDDDFFGRISKRDHHHVVNDDDDGIRPIRIEFAREGNCVITVGKTDGDSNECQTKAHCAVTSMLKAPLGRAAEGSLRVHVKMSPMAHPTDAPVENALTGLAPPALWGWLLDYPCVYCFSEEQGDRAQHNLDNSVLFELCASSLEVRGPKCGVPLRLCDDAFEQVLADHINDLAGRRPQLFGEVAWFRSEPPPNSVVAL